MVYNIIICKYSDVDNIGIIVYRYLSVQRLNDFSCTNIISSADAQFRLRTQFVSFAVFATVYYILLIIMLYNIVNILKLPDVFNETLYRYGSVKII